MKKTIIMNAVVAAALMMPAAALAQDCPQPKEGDTPCCPNAGDKPGCPNAGDKPGCPNAGDKQCCGTPKKDICLQIYSVRDLLNGVNKDGEAEEAYTSLLSRLAQMGYTSVEAANYNDGKFYGRAPADFKSDIENAGMKVLSSHIGHALSPEEIESGDFTGALEWWKQCIADHKAAGMEYIVMPWIGVPKTMKELDAYCKYLNAIGKLCKEAGLGFGYHNHAHEFQKVEDQAVFYDYLLENTDPDLVFFQMDLYWAVRGGVSPVDYFNRYPGRFKMFHVKDDKEIGQSGMVGFDAIFRNAETAGLKYLVVEVEQYSKPIEQSVKESIDYLLAAPFVKPSYSAPCCKK